MVGKGTEILARKEPGSKIGYMGPLGVGFSVKPVKTYVFIAGGVGIVPFYLFARQVAAKGHTPRMILLFGGRTQSMLYGIDDFAHLFHFGNQPAVFHFFLSGLDQPRIAVAPSAIVERDHQISGPREDDSIGPKMLCDAAPTVAHNDGRQFLRF